MHSPIGCYLKTSSKEGRDGTYPILREYKPDILSIDKSFSKEEEAGTHGEKNEGAEDSTGLSFSTSDKQLWTQHRELTCFSSSAVVDCSLQHFRVSRWPWRALKAGSFKLQLNNEAEMRVTANKRVADIHRGLNRSLWCATKDGGFCPPLRCKRKILDHTPKPFHT